MKEFHNSRVDTIEVNTIRTYPTLVDKSRTNTIKVDTIEVDKVKSNTVNCLKSIATQPIRQSRSSWVGCSRKRTPYKGPQSSSALNNHNLPSNIHSATKNQLKYVTHSGTYLLNRQPIALHIFSLHLQRSSIAEMSDQLFVIPWLRFLT